MEFKYEALDQNGKAQSGVVNAATQDAAIAALQRKGLNDNRDLGLGGGGPSELAFFDNFILPCFRPRPRYPLAPDSDPL